MCGRYSLTVGAEEIMDDVGVEGLGAFPPLYNIAPTHPILTIGIGANGQRQSQLVRWGLVPSWVKDPRDFSLIINARSETAAQKASFKSAIKHSRVLIPASSFYEWYRPADKRQPKTPYLIRPAQSDFVCFGGLVEHWMGVDGSEITSGCILTTPANDKIGNIHHRMPVVIKPNDYERWLDCKTSGKPQIDDLMTCVEDDFFEAHAVSEKVNKVANQGPDIQEPWQEPWQEPSQDPLQEQSALSTEDETSKYDDNQMDLFS